MSDNNREAIEVYVRASEDDLDVRAVTAEEPFPVRQMVATPAPTRIDTKQVTLATTTKLVVPANAARTRVVIENIDAAITVYFGGSGVSSTNGKRLLAGYTASILTSGPVYMVAASGTPVVDYWEELL